MSAVAFSLVITLFTETAERAKAMGIFGFVLSGGGVAGVLAGGILTDLFSWHWIFSSTSRSAQSSSRSRCGRCRRPGHRDRPARRRRRRDDHRRLMLAVYAIVNGNETGWLTAQTLGLLGAAVVLVLVFLAIEARIAAPPCRWRSSATSTSRRRTWPGAARRRAVRVLLLGAVHAAGARLQPARGRPGLPARDGAVGRVVALLGQARDALRSSRRCSRGWPDDARAVLFARTPVDGNWVVDILPATLAIGLGAGIAFNPILLAAMSDVAPEQGAGLASGVVTIGPS